MNHVKLNKNKTCSRSCGSALKWLRIRGTKEFEERIKSHLLAAKRTKYAMRLRERIISACRDLNIEPKPEIFKLYVRARNEGYHNGYSTASKRRRSW